MVQPNPPTDGVREPPRSFGGILRNLGPGLIIAGSIVGSGELIATTKTGAEAGFALLWLIIIGCVIKVFTQIEFGRYSINTGRTALDGLNELPGPRLRVNWVIWYWLVMTVFTTMQLGGIVGGVGQAMALSVPLSGDFGQLLKDQREWDQRAAPMRAQLIQQHAEVLRGRNLKAKQTALAEINAQVQATMGTPRPSQKTNPTNDDFYWCAILVAVTIPILVLGRYGMIQAVCTAFVAGFTFVTIGNVVSLQSSPEWAINWDDLRRGLSFGLPDPKLGASAAPLATAMATFGIIGVGASELIQYPYWCVEKGYARFSGPRDESDTWSHRARGWLRVLRWDAWCSMVVYTFATIAFYLAGAAVLYRQNLNPEKDQLISTLAEIYAPVFGRSAQVIFLFGAFAVLYSTFFSATAGKSRIAADAIRVFGMGGTTEAKRRWWVAFFCVFYPLSNLLIYRYFRAPAQLVLWSGVAQVVMLPMLAAAALYFRYRRGDLRTAPGRLWDILLWISAAGMLVAGTFGALVRFFPELMLLG